MRQKAMNTGMMDFFYVNKGLGLPMVQTPSCLDAAQTCPAPGSTVVTVHFWGKVITKTPEEVGKHPLSHPGHPLQGMMLSIPSIS